MQNTDNSREEYSISTRTTKVEAFYYNFLGIGETEHKGVKPPKRKRKKKRLSLPQFDGSLRERQPVKCSDNQRIKINSFLP